MPVPAPARYAVRIGTRAQRTRTVIGLPVRGYPKPPAPLDLRLELNTAGGHR